MKVTIRKTAKGTEAYIAKKDLEAMVVTQESPDLWGGVITLDNGWRFQLPELDPSTSMPITVEARKLPDTD